MLSTKEFEKLKKRLEKNPITLSATETKPKEPSYFQRVGQEYMQSAKDIISNVKRGAKAIEEQGIGGIPELIETGLRTAGEVAGATFAPITEAVAPIAKPLIEKIATIPGVSGAIEKVADWANRNPEAAKDLDAVLNISMLGGGKAIAEPFAKKVVSAGAEVGAKAIEVTGKTSKEVGKLAYGIAVPMEQATAKAVQLYQANKPTLMERVKGLFSKEAKATLEKPIIEAETAARTGLAGTEWQLGVQSKRIANKLWENNISPALKASTQLNDMKRFFSDLRERIIAETSDLSRRNTLLKAWESLNKDYGKVNWVSDIKLQSYKEGWTKFIPEKAFRGEPIAGALNDVRNMAAQEARSILYKKLGQDVKQAYLDYGNLQSIIEAGIKSVDPLRSKSAFRQAWEFILDKTITPIATYGGKVLYRTGEGLEFIGKDGAKKIKDLIKN